MNRTSVEDRGHRNDPRYWPMVLGGLGAALTGFLVLAGCSSGAEDLAPAAQSSVEVDNGDDAVAGGGSRSGTTQGTPEISSATQSASTTSLTVVKDSPTTSTSRKGPPVTFSPMFIGLVSEIDDDLAERMRSSWRDGCPVALAELRYLTLSYWNFDGQPVEGNLVVHVSAAADVVNVFQKLFAIEFPIQQMRLIGEFGADDDVSMAANNTSAFNCRFVAGTQSWSKHAFGLAIDINPLVNPYVQGSKIDPPGGAEFADRSIDFQGSVNAGDDVVDAFADIGWLWGGAWTWPDYQHFSAP